MSFLLAPALGMLGSLLFKQDGGKVAMPSMKSSRLSKMTDKKMVSQPYTKYVEKKRGGKIKKKK